MPTCRRMVPPASIARTSCSVITQSNRVSSNQSLCCRETEFCRQRQWRRNGSGRPRRPLQRRDPRQQSRQFGVTCPGTRLGTQFYRTGLCHCPNVASAGASPVAKVGPYAANPNQHRCRCTVRLDPAIKRRRTAQRHCREMTGNPLRLERYCRQFPGAKGAPRSCPAGSIAVAGLRWCGAAANRTEDLNVQICQEANEQEGPEAA